MDILIWIILTICAVFFTILMLTIEDFIEIKGFGIVLAIIALLFWIVAGLSAINLTITNLVVMEGSVQEYTATYPDTWPITLFYILASIFPLIMILKKIPEVWPGVEK